MTLKTTVDHGRLHVVGSRYRFWHRSSGMRTANITIAKETDISKHTNLIYIHQILKDIPAEVRHMSHIK